MAFERLTFKKSWENSEDFPAYEENESQVRADLQYHPDAVRDYLNEVLLAALESPTAAENIGAGEDGTVQSELDGIEAQLAALNDGLRDLAAGETPRTVRSAGVEFAKEEWEESGSGTMLLRISSADHGRTDHRFGWTIARLSAGEYCTGTWSAAGTGVEYDESTGDIVLTAEEAFAGRIVFFGV